MPTEFQQRADDACGLLLATLDENDVPWADAVAATIMLATYLCCLHPAGNKRALARDRMVSMLDSMLAQAPPEMTDIWSQIKAH